MDANYIYVYKIKLCNLVINMKRSFCSWIEKRKSTIDFGFLISFLGFHPKNAIMLNKLKKDKSKSGGTIKTREMYQQHGNIKAAKLNK